MAQNFHGTIELVVFDRFLDHGDGTAGKDLGQNLTIRVAGNDHDRKVWIKAFQLFVKFISRYGGEFQVEEYEIKALLFCLAEGLCTGPNNNSSKPGFFEKLLE